MQVSATRTLPEKRDSSTSGMVCGTEWGPAFFLQDSQSRFCLVTFISHRLWENIHAVLVIGYSGPTSDIQVTHGDGGRGGTGRSFWTIKVVPPPGIQIFQQGTCPNLFSKNSRNQEPNIQICEPWWGAFSFKSSKCSFLFLWNKESRGSHCAGQGHSSPWKLPVSETPAPALWTFHLSSLKCLH